MKKYFLAFTVAALTHSSLRAQNYPMLGFRRTHNEHSVPVWRDQNPPSKTFWQDEHLPGTAPDMARLRDSDRTAQETFGAFLLHSSSEFEFIRNCHDYAFGPYMSCMCSPPPEGDQKECWWMDDPS